MDLARIEQVTTEFSGSILDCIGNTPLIKFNNISSDTAANIYAKIEFLNPSGSIKDRVAKVYT